MGIETVLILGLAAMQADSAIRQSESQANAAIDQGNIDSREKAKEVKFRAARQQASFLNSGLTLEGTPMSVIQGTFSTGIEDVSQIGTNANRTAKNIISSGRTQALGSLAQGAIGSFAAGGFGSTPALGADAFSAGTAATTTAGGIQMPAGLPPSVKGF